MRNTLDITAGLSSITAAINLAKEIRSIDVQVDQASLKLKIADLTVTLADAKVAMTELSSTIQAKNAEIAELQKKIQFRSTKLIDEGQFRYFADGDGKPKGYPLCPKCENRGDYLAIVQNRSMGVGHITYFCPSCKSNFGSHVPHR